ncbi:MAG: methionine synthase [Bacteroidaceae bacterium]|nr:methionine synthase [Bacteroidaceae bacterium]
MVPVKCTDLKVDYSEIYNNMGLGTNTPDAVTENTTELHLKEALLRLKPRFEYHIVDGTMSEEGITLTTNGKCAEFNTGHIITHGLRNAQKFVIFVASVGPEYTAWTAELSGKGDVFVNFVVDCIGSAIVESVADYMEQCLQTELDQNGLKRTNRFSPGYCGWHVREQQLLFSLFPEKNPCQIELTDSCLMLPIKSVSGIIGIGTDVRYLPYSCNLCNFAMCYKRKKKQ